MSRVLIFSKGLSVQQPSRYRLPDGRDLAGLYPEQVAIAHFAPDGIDRTVVLLTEEAEAAWAETIHRYDPALPGLEFVRIPPTRTEQDQWVLFDVIASSIREGDEVILDITNGFRSIPLVALLAVTFIRVARKATIRGIGYGAADASEFWEGQRLIPYHDLTPMANLLTWTSATEAFETHGDGKSLAALIHDLRKRAFTTGRPLAPEERPRHLDRLANHLESFTLAIETLRHQQASTAASGLDSALREALEHGVDGGLIRPMRLMEPRIREVARPFIEATPGIALQEAMLAWLFERRMWLPYLSLLHEHLAEHLAMAFGFEGVLGGHDPLGREVHAWCDHLLGAIETYRRIREGQADPVELRKPGFRTVQSDEPEALRRFMHLRELDMSVLVGAIADEPAHAPVLRLSNQIRATRNTLMHGGLGRDPGAAGGDKVRRTIEDYQRTLSALPRPLFQVDPSSLLVGQVSS